MAHPAEVPLVGAAYYQESFAADFAATNLTTRSGKPNHAAQIVDFTNAGASAQSAIGTAVDGSTFTKVLAPGATYSCLVPLTALSASSGVDVSAIAYWWPTLGSTIN